MSAAPPPLTTKASDNVKGILIASVVMGMWLGSLSLLLSRPALHLHDLWWAIPAVAWQTFLYTGLFITAHDAMHGSIAPQHPQVNRAFGTLAVVLYALFSFRKLRHAHGKHHRYVATERDPDFHDGEHKGPVSWYLHFLREYISVWQIVGMALIFNVLEHVFGVSLLQLLLFWALPSVLSTIQLFYFGTYLPHREPHGGYDNVHRSKSNEFSVLWSFLTCYHFGYHWEHHEHPRLPWWRLPEARRHYAAQQSPV